jgi:hypothetical protein
MASYTAGEFLGGQFLPGLFSARLASKSLAKIDPTSGKLGGQISRAVISGAAAAGGLLIGLPPTITYAAVSGGLGITGAISGRVKDNKKIAKANAAIQQQNIIAQAALPPMQTGPQQETKKSGLLPVLGIGTAVAAALLF